MYWKRNLFLAPAFLAVLLATVPLAVGAETVAEKDATGLVKAIYERSLHDFNKVYNFQRAFSTRPEELALVDAQYRQLFTGPGKISQKERLFIAAVISCKNGDRDFAALQAEMASGMAGGAAVDFKTGEYKGRQLPPRTEAILDFAVKAHDAPAAIGDADIKALRNQGISPQGMGDIAALVAFTNRVNAACLAAGLPPEKPNVGEGIVRGASYDIPFERGDSHYDALVLARDGKVYFACCTHYLDAHAQFFSFDPKTKKVEHLADIGEVVGEKDAGAITQGKVHSNIYEYAGKLWFSTFKGYYQDDLQGRKPYPGGHFVTYDLKTGKFEDLAKVPEGEGVPTCILDTLNQKFYGITYPSGHLYAYDLKTKQLECIERGQLNYGCRPSLDPQGRIYLNRPTGGLARYDPTKPEGQRMERLAADTDEAAYGPAEKGAPVELLWGAADTVVYAVHFGTSSIEVRGDLLGQDVPYALHFGTSSIGTYDPATFKFTPLARLSAGEKRKCLANFRGTAPAWPRAANGVFYHVAVGPPCPDPPKETLKYNCYLTSYDPKTDRPRNHGPIYVENDRRLLYNAAGMLSPDGRTFLTIGWVEVNDPARVEKVKQLRAESSPPETSRRVYELRVVEIPLPTP